MDKLKRERRPEAGGGAVGEHTGNGAQPQYTATTAREVATGYAALGWRVLPVRPRDKRPALDRWPERATTDPDRIAEWGADANVGIATGPESGLLVLDVDGDPRELLGSRQQPPTPTQETGGGGIQYLYRWTPALDGCTTTKVGILPSVDVRGAGGYIVAPPSIHPSGKPYRWNPGLSPEDLEPAEPPEWLVELLRESRRSTGSEAGAIPEGQRNSALASHAGRLRRNGAGADAILAELRSLNAFRCRPPLDDAELQTIAASVSRYAPAEPGRPLTDAGNAERFVDQHGASVRYVPEWDWLVWTGSHWGRNALRPRQLMLETARSIHAEAAHETDPKAQAEIAKWARQSQQAQRVQAALWLAQPSVAANTDEFDREPWLLPVANGTLDLRSGNLQPHRREHYCTRLAPVYFDPDAQAPTWTAFLERVLPEPDMRAFVQRLAGYSLTGLTTEQKLAFLYGSGRNGKSVFVETLAALLGAYHTATRIETLSVTRGGGIPNDVAALAGARMVTVSETPEGSRLNESLVKDMTGGDTMTARYLRCEYFQFQPQFKLWIRGNHKPQIRGTDDGIWRRILLIPFKVQIPPEEVDPDLQQRLHAELPGILAWAVRGCLEWQREGLKPPQSVTDAVTEYRDEMDLLGEFLGECCVQSPQAWAPASELYRAYRQWCEAGGHQPASSTRFGLTLGERGFEKVKRGTVRYLGIGLRERSGQLESLDPSPSSSDSRARNPGNAKQGSRPSNRPSKRIPCKRCQGDGCSWCLDRGYLEDAA